MATLEQILHVISCLQAAYPYFRPSNPRATLGLYISHLGRFSQPVLQQAADHILDEMKFFPSVAELVQAARQAEARTSRRSPVDRLAEQRQGLEDACWLEGHFCREEWEALAAEYERIGYEFCASALREKATKIAEYF